MGRFWSLLFLMVPVLGVGLFVVAALPDSAPLENYWFPEDVSEHGYVIDNLFMFILYLTGVIFIATGGSLFLFLWKYDAAQNPQSVKFVHGNHTLEVVWAILPAAILLFIAIYQMDAWAENKLRRPMIAGEDGDLVRKPPLAQVKGEQFVWRIRYAGEDEQLFTPDDLFTVNDLHLPLDEVAVLLITSADVLHSFFLPSFRVKQDVIPGMRQFVWFKPVKEGEYDIVCAELCGWGHYKMKGRVTVERRDRFDAYIDQLRSEQNRTTLAAN